MSKPLNTIFVTELMHANPICVHQSSLIEPISELFASQQLYCVPVINDDRVCQGSISVDDLARSRQLFELKEYLGIMVNTLEDGQKAQFTDAFDLNRPINLTAREVMSVSRPAVYESDTLESLLPHLLSSQSTYALVLNASQAPVGVVFASDVLNYLYEAWPMSVS